MESVQQAAPELAVKVATGEMTVNAAWQTVSARMGPPAAPRHPLCGAPPVIRGGKLQRFSAEPIEHQAIQWRFGLRETHAFSLKQPSFAPVPLPFSAFSPLLFFSATTARFWPPVGAPRLLFPVLNSRRF